MPAKVLLQKNNRTGKFTFSLLSARGQVIAASEPYESKRGAIAALDAFRKNAADAILIDETQPKQPGATRTTATTTATTRTAAAKTPARATKTAPSRAAAAVEGNGRRTTKRTTTGQGATKKSATRRPRKTATEPVAPPAAD